VGIAFALRKLRRIKAAVPGFASKPVENEHMMHIPKQDRRTGTQMFGLRDPVRTNSWRDIFSKDDTYGGVLLLLRKIDDRDTSPGLVRACVGETVVTPHVHRYINLEDSKKDELTKRLCGINAGCGCTGKRLGGWKDAHCLCTQ
jgi:hypothetical protein